MLMQLGYLLTGGVLVACNALIVATVGRHPALRRAKEYVMVASLALADLVYGMGYATAAVRRSYLIVTQVRTLVDC